MSPFSCAQYYAPVHTILCTGRLLGDHLLSQDLSPHSCSEMVDPKVVFTWIYIIQDCDGRMKV